MHTTTLRKVGGSVMLAVPPVLLEILKLEPGAKVEVGIERGQLVVEPRKKRRYKLTELLAQCNPKARRSVEEKAWLDDKRVGRELL
jgi:antitoxin ChpS